MSARVHAYRTVSRENEEERSLIQPQAVERETRGNRKKASRNFMEIFTRCPRTRKRQRGVSRLVFLAHSVADATPLRPVSL